MKACRRINFREPVVVYFIVNIRRELVQAGGIAYDAALLYDLLKEWV